MTARLHGPLPLDIAAASRDALRGAIGVCRALRPSRIQFLRERDAHEIEWLEEALLRSWREMQEAA